MKKILLILICLITILPYSVKALIGIPSAIKDNNSDTSLTIEIMEGMVILPEYCSTGKGCTIIANPDVLKSVGKYDVNTYFHIKSGAGIKVYKIDNENYNKIEVSAKDFLKSKQATISLGNAEEVRDVILVATAPKEVEKNSNAFIYIFIGIIIISGSYILIKKKQN